MMSDGTELDAITCAECEAALSEYREGTLPLSTSAGGRRTVTAALVRRHLGQCDACASLLADMAAADEALRGLPRLAPPAHLVKALLDQVPAPVAHGRGWAPARGWRPQQWWAAVRSPRFALGLAMSVFAVAVGLNAAQINLRQAWSGFALEQVTPAHLAAVAQRRLNRGWARGVSYYHDLRVVYEIEAAMHEMRQPPPAPAAGRDRSQRGQPASSSILASSEHRIHLGNPS